MIKLNYLTVKGYCDTQEEFKDYLECLTLLPARIIEWNITPIQELKKIQFKIEYAPLI